MTTGRRESWRSTSRPRGARCGGCSPPRAAGILAPRRKKRRKNRGGDITPIRLRRRLRRQPRPAGSLAQARRDRQGHPRPTRPGRLRSARRPHAAQGCRARGVFVLSRRAAHDAPALRADDLRPRRREGASGSQILCRNGRSVRRWCARVTRQNRRPDRRVRRPVTACLPGIARNFPARILPLSKCPRTVSRSRSASRRAPLAAAPVALRGLLPLRSTPTEPMLSKGNVLHCTNRGTFYIAVDTDKYAVDIARLIVLLSQWGG